MPCGRRTVRRALAPGRESSLLRQNRRAMISVGNATMRLGVASNGGTDRSARRVAVAVVEESLIQSRKQFQDEALLTAVAHGAEAPNLALQLADATGDFNIEFVKELVAEIEAIDTG